MGRSCSERHAHDGCSLARARTSGYSSIGRFMNRRLVLFSIKLLFSLGILGWVYSRLLSTTGAGQLWHHISHLAWGWLWFGVAMQLLALACSVLRWQRLLIGQGIHAPLRHLFGSFMIGRLF